MAKALSWVQLRVSLPHLEAKASYLHSEEPKALILFFVLKSINGREANKTAGTPAKKAAGHR
jgi:hypothetical protein